MNAPTFPQLRTMEDLKQSLMGDRVAFPPAQWIIEDLVAEGDQVAGWATFRGVHSAPWYGLEPTGNEVAVTVVCIARFDGGKIVEARYLDDLYSLLAQVRAVSTMA